MPGPWPNDVEDGRVQLCDEPVAKAPPYYDDVLLRRISAEGKALSSFNATIHYRGPIEFDEKPSWRASQYLDPGDRAGL